MCLGILEPAASPVAVLALVLLLRAATWRQGSASAVRDLKVSTATSVPRATSTTPSASCVAAALLAACRRFAINLGDVSARPNLMELAVINVLLAFIPTHIARFAHVMIVDRWTTSVASLASANVFPATRDLHVTSVLQVPMDTPAAHLARVPWRAHTSIPVTRRLESAVVALT